MFYSRLRVMYACSKQAQNVYVTQGMPACMHCGNFDTPTQVKMNASKLLISVHVRVCVCMCIVYICVYIYKYACNKVTVKWKSSLRMSWNVLLRAYNRCPETNSY